MIKKIYHLIIILLFVSPVIMAQDPTVEIPDVSKTPGAVEIPIYMNDFTNVGSIQFYIEFNDDLLSFTELTNKTVSGTWVANQSGPDKLTITYTIPGTTGVNIDGKVCDMNFQYLGGFSSELNFLPGGEVGDANLGTISCTYTNGSISPLPSDGTLTVGTAAAFPADVVEVPVSVEGAAFAAFQSLTLLTGYDEAKLTWVGVTNSVLGEGMVAAASDGVVTVTWSGGPFDYSTLTDIFDLKFIYNGGGDAPLAPLPGCEVSDAFLQLQNVSYVEGAVNAGVAPAVVTLGNETAMLGDPVSVPVNLAGGPDNIGSVLLYVEYDSDKLTWVNTTAGTVSGITAAASGGVVTATWTDMANATSLDGDLMFLNFVYNGIGTSDLVFDAGCEFGLTDLSTLDVTYVNGSAGQTDPFDGKVVIDNVSAFNGESITVPVAFSDFSVDAFSVELVFAYDPVQLTYIDFFPIPGAVASAADGFITFVWTSPEGYDLNSAFLYLHFVYNGGGAAPLTFYSGSEIYDEFFNLFNTEYVDGGVNTMLGVNIKVFLQGPYAGGGQMNTTLLTENLIPLNQPYSGAPWNYAGTESVTSIPADVVDWVLIALRTDTPAATTVAQRAGFVLADGSVVDVDGSSLLSFDGIAAGNYYIVVKHRNHLAIMSANAHALNGASDLYDFTDDIAKAYGANAMAALSGGAYGMWGGNVNSNANVRYNGPANDRAAIFSGIGNTVVQGYLNEDVNMNGTARYNGPANDRTAIFIYVGNNVVFSNVP